MFKDTDTVSVLIPNFNGEKLLRENLPKVLAAKKNPQNRISEVIVVDDGSWDGSASLIKRHFPEVKLIKHKVNRGFSSAVNTAVRSSKGELIVLLNNDVVPQEDFLVSVFSHFQNEGVFGVSLHEMGYPWGRGYFKDGFVNIGGGVESANTHTTFWISGGSGIFRRDYWMALGGMDEKIFSPFYWEDIDLCFRAAKRGYLLLWEPGAKVVHKHESTISRFPKKYVERIRERNQLLFIWKNINSPSFIRKHVVGILQRVVRHPGYLIVVLMALFRLRAVLKARKKERKEAKLSDETIFARFK